MKIRTRTSIAAVAIASVVGGGIAGAVLAGPTAAIAQEAEDDAPTTADGVQTIDDVLAELVDEGVLTQAQADAVADALEEARPERGLRGGPGGHRFGGNLEVVAETLNLTVDELGEALMDGSTLADIAVAQGVDAQDVVDLLVAQAQERLDAAVADGHLTADEAAERVTDIGSHITDMVNGDLEFDGRGRGRGHGGPGAFGGPFGGDDTNDTGAGDAVFEA